MAPYHILEFCHECGNLLVHDPQRCPNCDNSVLDRDARMKGTFHKKDADRFHEIYGEEP